MNIKNNEVYKIVQSAFGEHVIFHWSKLFFSYYRSAFDDVIEAESSRDTVSVSAGVPLL
jgi:hypothetical protein